MRIAILLAAATLACGKKPEPKPKIWKPPPSGRAVELQDTLPVATEDVTFTVGQRPIPGTIVAPKVKGPWPAVLILAGSGPTDRDWNGPLLATRNGSGKLLAEELARHGVVAMRFDKAFTGKNPGPPLSELSLDTYRDEALAALELLRKRFDVRKDRIFVAGHSEGGIHATRLAAAESRLAGVLYLSSASRTLADTLLTQLEGNLRNPLAGLSEAAIQKEMTSLRAAFKALLAGEPIDPTQVSTIPQLQQLVAGLASGANAALVRSLFGYDNAAEAPRLQIPMLVVNGAKDVQVDPEIDARRLYTAILAANRDVTLHISPDADHVLKHEPKSLADLRADLVSVVTNYNADGRVLDPDLARAVVTWLAAKTAD